MKKNKDNENEEKKVASEAEKIAKQILKNTKNKKKKDQELLIHKLVSIGYRVGADIATRSVLEELQENAKREREKALSEAKDNKQEA